MRMLVCSSAIWIDDDCANGELQIYEHVLY
jgi:hypothetical protein